MSAFDFGGVRGRILPVDMESRLRTIIRAQAEGKALAPNPAFMDPGRPVGVVDLSVIKRTGNGLPKVSQREARRHTEAYGGSQSMDWVADCLRFTADIVASAPYHFAPQGNQTSTHLPGAQDYVAPQTLADLIDSPNPYVDYVEMMELIIIDLLLVGNAYIYKFRPNAAGQPLALYRLAPPYVQVVPAPWGIQGYEYKVPQLDTLDIDTADVIHFKLANPNSAYYGLGLIQSAGRAADLELALTDSQASYMENHAMPSLSVSSDRRVPRDVFKKIRSQLRARAQGPRNSGELLVLEAGLKLDSIAPNAGEAGYAPLAHMSRDRIFAWFHMSPKLLGISDETGGADKTADFERIFDAKTIRPLMNKIQRKLTRELTRAWGVDYCIDYEYQMAPEDMAALASTFGAMPGIIVDEVRAFAHLGPHPDPTIGSMTLNLPGENAGTGQPGDTPTDNGFPDKNLTGEPGRPPNAANTRAFPRNGAPLPAGAAAVAGKALARIPKGMTLQAAMARLDALGVATTAKED